MIRGYGLPSDAAAMYNGYGAVVPPKVLTPVPAPGYSRSLFHTLPDSQLGGYDDFGVNILGTSRTTFSPATGPVDPVAAAGGDQTMVPLTAGGDGGGFNMGLAVLALGAVGLFFLMKK